jgi:hypothetical protein
MSIFDKGTGNDKPFFLLTFLAGSIIGVSLMGLYYTYFHHDKNLPNVGSSESNQNLPNVGSSESNQNLPNVGSSESNQNLPNVGSSESNQNLPNVRSIETYQNLPNVRSIETYQNLPIMTNSESTVDPKIQNDQNDEKKGIGDTLISDDTMYMIPTVQQIMCNNCSIYKKERENIKIREVNNAPLELRKRFENKGYVFIHQNLSTVNVELNEFIELMRKYDLYALNGCKDPNNCKCTFRYKRCRSFMIRKYSNMDDMQFFTPSCTGVTIISPSNKDIQNGTLIHEFVQMFQNKFCDRVMDLVSYIDYIIDPLREQHYVVDITLIADPYFDDPSTNGKTSDASYGQPISKNENPVVSDPIDRNDNVVIEIDTKYTNVNSKMNVDRKKYSLLWHQDQFVESKTKQKFAYDYIAFFILGAKNVQPHKLMIGRLKNDIDISGMNLEQLQEHITTVSETTIDDDNNSDIGYVIDQGRNYFHKHSDFYYKDTDAKRNVITIRIKYLK